MVPCSTIHFSSPLFFHPVRSFPLKRETHSLCGGAFATTAATTSIAAARNAPILLTGKPPSLLLKNQRVRSGETYHKFNGDLACFLPLPSVSARGRFVTKSAIGFARLQIPDAQLRQVAGIALINLLHRQILVTH